MAAPAPGLLVGIIFAGYSTFKGEGHGDDWNLTSSCDGDAFMNAASSEPLSPVLREITGTYWVSRTFSLRFEIWSAEVTLRPEVRAKGIISDEHDAHARHWAAFCGNEMVAAARMCVHTNQEECPDAPAFTEICLPTPVATLNRLVVHPSFRNRGFGSELCHCRIEGAKTDGAKCVVGTYTDQRVASLEKCGLRLTGQKWILNHSESLTIVHAMVLEF